jgi:hypothetical protein
VGKAKILENKGEGLYSIELDLGAERKQAVIDQMTSEIAALLEARADLFEAVGATRIDLESARAAYDAAVSAYVEAARASETQEEVEAAARLLDEPAQALAEAADAFQIAEAALEDNEAEAGNLERKRSVIESVAATRILDAWCADYSDEFEENDEVDTVESPNEPQSVIIAPGGQTESDDGDLMKTDFMTPWQAFYNAAIFPGWQKSKPTYRLGEITAIDSDGTCRVRLDLTESSAQGLPVNLNEDELRGVPVDYMSCGIGIFRQGDRVVVRFKNRSWEEPEVIGFESEPRTCRVVEWRELKTPDSFGNVPDNITFWIGGGDSLFIDELEKNINSVTIEIREGKAAWRPVPFQEVEDDGTYYNYYFDARFEGPSWVGPTVFLGRLSTEMRGGYDSGFGLYRGPPEPISNVINIDFITYEGVDVPVGFFEVRIKVYGEEKFRAAFEPSTGNVAGVGVNMQEGDTFPAQVVPYIFD